MWIGIVLMPILIRISILMPIQILDLERNHNDADPHEDLFLHMLENPNFFYTTTLVHPFLQRRRLIGVIDTDPDPVPWMLIPIRIR